MSKITLKNISSATVVISSPDANINRSLIPGRTISLTEKEYEDLMFEPGIQNMIQGGYIRISGVEEDRVAVETPTNVLDKNEIETMIENREITKFANYIKTAPQAAKETIVNYVVNNNVTDNAFTALIKTYCGVDVIQAIAIKHQAEEK